MINHEDFQTIAEAEVDDRGRLTLSRATQGHRRFRLAVNEDTGEILLTPMVSISAREATVRSNTEVMKLINAGLADAGAGRVTKVSFKG